MFISSTAGKVSGVYLIRCSASGKSYIGRSTSIGGRVMGHLYILRKGTHYNKLLQKEFSIYGENCFSYEVLEVVTNPTKEALLEAESRHIERFDFENLYNARRSANVGAVSGEASDATRKRLGDRQVAEKNHFYGKKHSEETLERMREARKQLPQVKCPFCEKTGYASSIALHVKAHKD